MKILVTGGAGYIGSHTVALLRKRGDFVVVLDSMEFGHRAALGGGVKNPTSAINNKISSAEPGFVTPALASDGIKNPAPAILIVGSIADKELVKQIILEYEIDAVVHFAAYKAAGESMSNPGKYFENNFVGSLRLIEACVESGVRKLVFSSTAAVYGTPEVLPVSEAAPLHPENPYGESKLMVEKALRWFSTLSSQPSLSSFQPGSWNPEPFKRPGFNYVALRYFNAAGATLDGSNGEDPRYAANLIPLVMNVATGRSPGIKVFGNDYPTADGTCVRDYIHVLDLAAAHAAALDFLSRPKNIAEAGFVTPPGFTTGIKNPGSAKDAAEKTLPTLSLKREAERNRGGGVCNPAGLSPSLERGDEGSSSGVFNLGTGQGASVMEVINLAREITGKEIPCEIVPRRPGDPAAVWADNRKAVAELGWHPQYGIREIISSAWQWHEKHPDGFAD